ncbi:protein AGENET DOMAIN (AGD)-CONTAINING P1 isoform X2 [Rhodamnia argentea]|uniref:Protein AGENET DOMAIN (AGD)-CONTAINING P1 isoform X2 n=1 Tax=Rhodamnia argentea TaxID=178133 RepID=A0A8B8PYE6_9MYRT|nr:protein AGENET DOMAIN (AGD)-CONTAINING P1 isoform X2 [Rhodamnia argentea]
MTLCARRNPTPAMARLSFAKGDEVEILRSCSDPELRDAFYPATVLRSPARAKELIFVEYLTLPRGSSGGGGGGRPERLREYVGLARARPAPPRELHERFRVGDEVDAYRENGWHFGRIVEIREDSKYLVAVGGGREEVEFGQWELRRHREWSGDGVWSPLFVGDQKQEKSSTMELKSCNIKFKIRLNKRTSLAPPEFGKGKVVEVSSDEKGYEGSWFSAVIVNYIGHDKYLVEYLTLKADDETEPLREEAYSRYIRPFPPHLPASCFKRLDKVDAWYNDGWWVGVISKVLKGSQYIVYFSTSHEELIFDKSNLRLHKDWIDGKWVIASRDNSTEVALQMASLRGNTEYGKPNVKVKFSKGMKVEVRSDEDGYRGSWYTAVIDDTIGDKFLVEYQTLKTDDETKFLKEVAESSHIRPFPPDIERVHTFAQHEMVDAWYNDGWWVGHISRILGGLKYKVYFITSSEELEFEHLDLRPHQEWIGGRWVITSKGHRSV